MVEALWVKLLLRSGVSLVAHSTGCLGEIASVSDARVGALGVHFDGLVHTTAPETSALACPIIWFLVLP